MRSRRTASRGRTRRSPTRVALPARRPSARHSASALRARSHGRTSRSSVGRSRASACPAACVRGRNASTPARSTCRCRTPASSRTRSPLSRMAELEPLYTAEEMRAAEAGHDVEKLMERAGRSVAEFILDEYGDGDSITVVCGPGNNGGDGRVAADVLRAADCDVRVVEARPDGERKDLGSPGIIVDALFGTGFSGEPRPAAARLIEQINDLDVDVVAGDVPSGGGAASGGGGGAGGGGPRGGGVFPREEGGLRAAP